MSTLKVGEIKHESFTGTTQLKLDSAGRLLVGTTTEGHANADDLTVATSGTTGITIRSGSSNSGNIYFSDATSGTGEAAGAIEYSHSDNRMSFFTTTGTERMRIDSSGNVGIGTTSPDQPLHIKSNTPYIKFEDDNDNQDWQIEARAFFSIYDVTDSAHRLVVDGDGNVGIGTTSPAEKLDVIGNIKFGANSNGLIAEDGVNLVFKANAAARNAHIMTHDGNEDINLDPSGFIQFECAGSEAMRIDSSGRVGLGKADPDHHLDVSDNTARAGIRVRQHTNNTANTYSNMILRHAAATSGQNAYGILFQNNGGSEVGRIDYGQSTTQYRTSSDYRLKENVVTISDGITRVKTLKPYRFNWIAEKGQPKVDGFFAHEVTAVPEAISGTKDEVDSDNNPVYQGIDLSKLVPLLTAALQEAIGRIEALEAK